MSPGSFLGAISLIASYQGPRQSEVEALLACITELPCDPTEGKRIHDILMDAQLAYFPWRLTGDPSDDLTEDRDYRLGLAIALVENAEVLNGPDWFNCNADLWLRVLAADVLGERLGTYKFIEIACETADEGKQAELRAYLPDILNAGIQQSREVLAAASGVRAEAALQSAARSRSSVAATKIQYCKNRKLYDEFLQYYVEHIDAGLSKAELARRFLNILIEREGSIRNLPWVGKEQAERSLLRNLNKLLSQDTKA